SHIRHMAYSYLEALPIGCVRGDRVHAKQLPRALGFIIYREHLDGASVEELSEALHVPQPWVEERIEAVRLCLEKQVRVECKPIPRLWRDAPTGRGTVLNIRSANRHHSH